LLGLFRSLAFTLQSALFVGGLDFQGLLIGLFLDLAGFFLGSGRQLLLRSITVAASG
jgi:hypothetical protein